MKRCVLWFTALVFVLSLTVILGGCNASRSSEGRAGHDLIEEVSRRGVLRVGMSTFVPWAMNDKNGELVGFEIDVARQLAADLGVDVEFVPTPWSGIIPALLTGDFDLIIGGMGITAERSLKVNFSIPYDYTGMAILAHRGRAAGFDSLEAFNDSSVAITARIGTTAAAAARRFMPEAELKLFDDEAQALQELRTGRVHAMVASAPLPAYQALDNPDTFFLPIEGTFTREPIGFAVRKGQADALNVFDSWIRIKQSAGWLAERKAYWFESREWLSLIE